MKIISDKDLRVTNSAGGAVLFQAGVPREIGDEMGLAAMQLGAKEYNDKYVEEVEAEVATFVEIADTADTEEDVVTALRKLIEEADPSTFKADGTPKAQTVNKLVGRTVRTDEREAAWELALNT
jgi:hypothetical protein